jgi:hypothetical protein
MASSSVGRQPVLVSRSLKSHACNVVWGVRLAKGRLGLASWENGCLKRRRKPPVSAATFPETFVEL